MQEDAPTQPASDSSPGSRRSRQQLRELVLDAAVELLRRDGLAVRPTSITYKQVFDHLEETQGIKVTRGSVHERIWASQEDFQLAVVERASLWETDSTPGTTEMALHALEVARTQDTDADHVLSAVVRATAPQAQAAADEDELYFAWVGLTLAIAYGDIDGEARSRVAAAVGQSYAFATQETARMYQELGRAIGLRPRPGMFASAPEAWEQLAKLGMALSEGCTLRTRFDPDELREVEIAPDDEADREAWHPFAIGMLALLRFFLEPDPDR